MDHAVKYKPAKLFYDSYTPEECEATLSPIIFVHGLGGLHTSWTRVWKRIADETRRKVFSIDLRNHAKSEWNDIFALDALVTDIENFATENDLKQCCFIGHSLGGKVCLRLAMMKSELIDRLIVEEATVRNPNSAELKNFQIVHNAMRKFSCFPKTMSENQVRSILSKHAGAAFPGWGVSDAAYNIPLRRNADGSIGFDFNFEVISKFMDDESAFKMYHHQNCMKFFGPTLFVYGKGSQLQIDQDMMLKEFFPNAKLKEFSRTAHVLHIECPDEYVENVAMFLNH